MDQLWARTWVYVGHYSQVAQPGDCITASLGAELVMMVRQADGSV